MRLWMLAAIVSVAACSSENNGGDAPDAGGTTDLGRSASDAGPRDADPARDVDPGVDTYDPVRDIGPGRDADDHRDADEGDTGGTSNLGDLSDEFNGNALDPSWTFFHDDLADAVVENGAMSIEMTSPRLWFDSGTAPLIYKLVSGNFKVTSRVHTRRASDTQQAPDRQFHLGGLMARDPHGTDQGGEENYVFIVVGRDGNDISVEHKTTTDGHSVYNGPTFPSSDAELRVCRVGQMFYLYKREIGAGSWMLATTYDRPDLPATLQVGGNAYGNANGMVDLRVFFDEITFADVSAEGDCTVD